MNTKNFVERASAEIALTGAAIGTRPNGAPVDVRRTDSGLLFRVSEPAGTLFAGTLPTHGESPMRIALIVAEVILALERAVAEIPQH